MNELVLAGVFIPLLTAHLIIDFLAQSRGEVERKHRLHMPTFAIHAGEHALLAYVLVGAWGLWWMPALVFAAHFGIDLAKETAQRGFLATHPESSARIRLSALVIDQIAHVVSLLLIARLAQESVEAASEIGAPDLATAAMVVASGWIVTARVGGFVVGFATQPFLDELSSAEAEKAASERPARGLARGGAAIGMLERTLIYLSALTGVPEGAGFLIAAKSVFRFGEVKDSQNRMEAEYIIIGTFMSFAWGIAGAWGAVAVLRWLG